LGQQCFDLPLQVPVVFDAALTFLGRCFADRFCRSFAFPSSGSAIIEAVKLGPEIHSENHVRMMVNEKERPQNRGAFPDRIKGCQKARLPLDCTAR
jgi:hypothetical protein